MDFSSYFTTTDFRGILPEVSLLLTAVVILTFEILARPRRQVMLILSLFGITVAGGYVWQNSGAEMVLFGGMLTLNSYSTFFDSLYLVVAAAALLVAQVYLERRRGELRGEYYSLILFATIGMMLMTRANDLVVVFLGLELLSLSLYVLVGFLRHDVLSNEGGIKYLLLGAFSTGFFLFGAALAYGATGTTNFEGIAAAIASSNVFSSTVLDLGIGLLIVGFAFKVAVVPFHMWSPDVYQGAPTSVTAFLCTAPKAAGFGALLKLFLVAFSVEGGAWQDLFWLLAVLTMTVGNISALVQSNIKRMLAFSSVAHAGYLLIGVMVMDVAGTSSVMFYLLVYSAMNLGAFGVVSFVEDQENGLSFDDYRGLASRHPWLSIVLALFMLSLAGFPPTAGFVAKYGLFSAAVAKGYIWIVVIAVLNTLASFYYYARLIVKMYMEAEEEALTAFPSIHSTILLTILAAVILLFGLTPGWLIENTTLAAAVFSP